MTTISLHQDRLSVRFTRTEKILGLVRDQSIPLTSVTSARVEQVGLHAVRGLRAPGLGLPGRWLVGTWRGHGRTLVSVRRGEPALVVELTGHRFDQLVLGTPDAADLVGRLGAGDPA
jgi:hypothetical protein